MHPKKLKFTDEKQSKNESITTKRPHSASPRNPQISYSKKYSELFEKKSSDINKIDRKEFCKNENEKEEKLQQDLNRDEQWQADGFRSEESSNNQLCEFSQPEKNSIDVNKPFPKFNNHNHQNQRFEQQSVFSKSDHLTLPIKTSEFNIKAKKPSLHQQNISQIQKLSINQKFKLEKNSLPTLHQKISVQFSTLSQLFDEDFPQPKYHTKQDKIKKSFYEKQVPKSILKAQKQQRKLEENSQNIKKKKKKSQSVRLKFGKNKKNLQQSKQFLKMPMNGIKEDSFQFEEQIPKDALFLNGFVQKDLFYLIFVLDNLTQLCDYIAENTLLKHQIKPFYQKIWNEFIFKIGKGGYQQNLSLNKFKIQYDQLHYKKYGIIRYYHSKQKKQFEIYSPEQQNWKSKFYNRFIDFTKKTAKKPENQSLSIMRTRTLKFSTISRPKQKN